MSAGGSRVRLVCTSCKTLCEVTIPAANPTSTKPVRYQVRCPSCKAINEPQNPLRAGAGKAVDPKRKGAPPAPPAAKRQNAPEAAPGLPKKPAGANSDAEPRPASSAEAARPAAVDKPAGAKAAAKPAKPSQNGARGGTSAEEEPLFLVERILGQRERKGKLEYHIKWLGYDASHNSWEPKENILDSKLTDAWKQSQQASSSGASSSSAQPTAPVLKKAASKEKAPRKPLKPPKAARPSEPASGHANRKSAVGEAYRSLSGSSGAKQDAGSDFDLDDFDIQEATEKIEAKPSRSKGRARSGSAWTAQGQATRKVWLPPPSVKQPAFELTRSTPSCEEAYHLAVVKPRWEVGDTVEVAWSGKGFEGGWSVADVIQLDGRNHVMARFHEFVDNDGSPLVEKLTHDRLRLPPPPPSSDWAPSIGEKIEGLWNDCWWEGVLRELHPFKGLLFQYDRYANWLWLPLRCTRPRPALFLYYPQREPAALDAMAGAEEGERPPGLCGQQGCMLLNNHLGLCQVKTVGSRRENMKEKAELQQQEQLWHEIKSSREASTKVAEARAEALLRTEQSGADIKAPRGNKTQWHANFQVDEFIDTARDVPVIHESEAGLQLRGMLIIGPGHTLADTYHVLRTELQIEPVNEAYMVACLTPHDGKRFSFSAYSPQTEVLGLLPPQPCQFLLDQATTKSKQPKQRDT